MLDTSQRGPYSWRYERDDSAIRLGDSVAADHILDGVSDRSGSKDLYKSRCPYIDDSKVDLKLMLQASKRV